MTGDQLGMPLGGQHGAAPGDGFNVGALHPPPPHGALLQQVLAPPPGYMTAVPFHGVVLQVADD